MLLIAFAQNDLCESIVDLLTRDARLLLLEGRKELYRLT